MHIQMAHVVSLQEGDEELNQPWECESLSAGEKVGLAIGSEFTAQEKNDPVDAPCRRIQRRREDGLRGCEIARFGGDRGFEGGEIASLKVWVGKMRKMKRLRVMGSNELFNGFLIWNDVVSSNLPFKVFIDC